MKSLEERQAERAERRMEEAAARKASGAPGNDAPEAETTETAAPKRGKKDATDPGAGNGAGGGNPFNS